MGSLGKASVYAVIGGSPCREEKGEQRERCGERSDKKKEALIDNVDDYTKLVDFQESSHQVLRHSLRLCEEPKNQKRKKSNKEEEEEKKKKRRRRRRGGGGGRERERLLNLEV